MADNIELTIKIDEDDCHRIISGFADEDDAVLFANLLKNAVPLPKGHGRLIDEKVAYKKFYSRCYAKIAKEVFADVPTIIEADKGDKE